MYCETVQLADVILAYAKIPGEYPRTSFRDRIAQDIQERRSF